ncbi:MAG: 7-cyano-7-deazaguanine synthase [Pyrinomonadaceae bacterium]|jgi:7-cyano-7-deazaguanine synthase|nr:7-cyano-7-deazaguanine synthase [Pyrinomonadaceae bacterium]
MGGHDDIVYRDSAALADEQTELAVCLVSGGMDSCVTAAIAHRDVSDLAFLHISYGQRTEVRERQAFEALAEYYGVDKRLVVSLAHLAQIGGSSLTDPGIDIAQANLQSQSIPTSYVPFRNAHLLSVATSWAEVIGGRYIYIGAVAEDSSGYPDCRPEFYEAFQRTIELGTKPSTRIQIRTPVIDMKKSEIVRLAQKLKAPLELTWSCYAQSDRACGQCDSCALRLRAFRDAEVSDPIPYVLDSARFAY